MSAPLVVSIPHQLGREEATRRLKGGLSRAAASVPVLTVDEERWEGDQMFFRVRALGQAASGQNGTPSVSRCFWYFARYVFGSTGSPGTGGSEMPWRMTSKRCRPMPAKMMAGMRKTWMAKKRLSVAPPTVSPPARRRTAIPIASQYARSRSRGPRRARRTPSHRPRPRWARRWPSSCRSAGDIGTRREGRPEAELAGCQDPQPFKHRGSTISARDGAVRPRPRG